MIAAPLVRMAAAMRLPQRACSVQGRAFRSGTRGLLPTAVAARVPGAGGPCRTSRRGFGWTEDDAWLNFKVKADNCNVQKLAGGLLMRCEQRHETVLEAVGNRSVYNSVKALVLANRFAQEARAQRGDDQVLVRRVGFIPSFARKEQLQWMRLRVVAVGDRPSDGARARSTGVDVSDLEAPSLKVGASTEFKSLQNAILANWMKRCEGASGEPVLMAMGEASVTRAVKGSAFALRELSKRRGGARPFVCFPDMEQVQQQPHESGAAGEKQTVVVLRLETAPSWGDRGAKIIVRAKLDDPAVDAQS